MLYYKNYFILYVKIQDLNIECNLIKFSVSIRAMCRCSSAI